MLGGVTAKVGDVVPVGQTIAWLLKPGEAVPDGDGAQRRPAARWTRRPAAAAAAAAPAAAAPASAAGAKISPKARKLAREHGVDIATVRGSGPGGEILADDILKAAQAARGQPQFRAARRQHPPRSRGACRAARPPAATGPG